MAAKRYYMHTIDGRAAFFDERSGQIVFAEHRDHWQDDYPLVVMRESVEQIREDQRKTREYRKRMGFKDDVGKYDYVILSLGPGWIPWKVKAPAKKKARRRSTSTA